MSKNEIDASVAIQVLPNVQENDEIVKIVDEVIAYIKSKNLNTHVGPFETTILSSKLPGILIFGYSNNSI